MHPPNTIESRVCSAHEKAEKPLGQWESPCQLGAEGWIFLSLWVRCKRRARSYSLVPSDIVDASAPRQQLLIIRVARCVVIMAHAIAGSWHVDFCRRCREMETCMHAPVFWGNGGGGCGNAAHPELPPSQCGRLNGKMSLGAHRSVGQAVGSNLHSHQRPNSAAAVTCHYDNAKAA